MRNPNGHSYLVRFMLGMEFWGRLAQCVEGLDLAQMRS
ncbi:hypothetical protein ABOONEI_2031 [Aciduliprofundum boonei T469]|nr:hypothetical protein ABOONEI_2519 [Aciduliprofundum boonei T469]EDY37110.1 hypothetical protein ABOONEI_2031 [Aciduliprofundum boonei T469]